MLFSLPDNETLYQALVARDPAFEGRAYVCAKTTGVFFRLTCPARILGQSPAKFTGDERKLATPKETLPQ
jgi:methylphosphotriester-DNA--protein-cysteine methyltransferase